MDCSLPGSSVHGFFQARILEWLPFPSPGDRPDPRIEPESLALQADSLPLHHQGSPNLPFTGEEIKAGKDDTMAPSVTAGKGEPGTWILLVCLYTPHSTASAFMQVHEVILEKKKRKILKLSFLANVICQTPPSQALAQPLDGSQPVRPPQGEERLHGAGSQICLQRKSHWDVPSGTTQRIHSCDPGLPCDLRPRTISLYLVAPGELQIQFKTSCDREKRTYSHPERHNR